MKNLAFAKLLQRFVKNKLGLGTPVANIIILMAAVILSTTVVLFAMNVATSQVQKENLYISNSHVWFTNSTHSVAAISIINTGPTDIVLTKIVIKGLQSAWNGTGNYIIYTKSNQTLPGDLPLIEEFDNTGNTTIAIGGKDYTFSVAGDDFTLRSGWTMAFYIALPNHILLFDIGTPIRIVISTTQGVYCSEAVVQSA